MAAVAVAAEVESEERAYVVRRLKRPAEEVPTKLIVVAKTALRRGFAFAPGSTQDPLRFPHVLYVRPVQTHSRFAASRRASSVATEAYAIGLISSRQHLPLW